VAQHRASFALITADSSTGTDSASHSRVSLGCARSHSELSHEFESVPIRGAYDHGGCLAYNSPIPQIHIKPALAIVLALALFFIGAVAHAKWITWNAAERPPVSLSDALVVATDTLKKEGKNFYCIQATLGRRITAADWELLFGAPDGSQLWVNVGADRSIELAKLALSTNRLSLGEAESTGSGTWSTLVLRRIHEAVRNPCSP
jgi:hypothetical protein